MQAHVIHCYQTETPSDTVRKSTLKKKKKKKKKKMMMMMMMMMMIDVTACVGSKTAPENETTDDKSKESRMYLAQSRQCGAYRRAGAIDSLVVRRDRPRPLQRRLWRWRCCSQSNSSTRRPPYTLPPPLVDAPTDHATERNCERLAFRRLDR